MKRTKDYPEKVDSKHREPNCYIVLFIQRYDTYLAYIRREPKLKMPKNNFTVYRRKQQTALSTLIVEAVLVEMKSSKTIPNVSQIHELIGVYKPQTM